MFRSILTVGKRVRTFPAIVLGFRTSSSSHFRLNSRMDDVFFPVSLTKHLAPGNFVRKQKTRLKLSNGLFFKSIETNFLTVRMFTNAPKLL